MIHVVGNEKVRSRQDGDGDGDGDLQWTRANTEVSLKVPQSIRKNF